MKAIRALTRQALIFIKKKLCGKKKGIIESLCQDKK